MFPQPDKKIYVTNGKNAYQGTISHVKNIDLSEDGYIKLAPPQLLVYSSETDGDFGLPYDVFTRTDSNYKIHTPGNAFELNTTSLAVTEDSGSGSQGSDGVRIFPWVSNNWFVNGSAAVYSYDGSTVNSNYVSRIATALDFIELFISRNTLVGRTASSVNVVNQYRASDYATTGQSALTLPANYAVTGLAFSNELMGVATKQRKNQGNAIFAIWDGADTSANSIYPVNDPYILDVAAYQNSWVIFTSEGRLLYFNGGGFDELGHLANFDLEQRLVDLTPTTSLVFGKILHADGDKIYVNCASLPETSMSRKPYKPFYAGGAYCYDPSHGFYHTASPSYSKYETESVTFGSNVGTTSASHFMETGDEVFVGTTSNELIAGKTYYVIKLTATTFSLANTYDEAFTPTAKSITNGSYSIYYTKRYDYGAEAIKVVDCGLVRNERDYSGYATSGAIPFFVGAKLHPNNLAATRVNAITMAVPVMHNRGYFVMGKWQTGNLQDVYQAVAVKYTKLKNGDKIIVKAKTKDTQPVIVGDQSLFETAAYSGKGALWDGSGTYFTTTEDLTGVEEGDEVHVFAGPGAGQSAHIVTISGNTTDGWEVILDEAIRGTVSGRVSCVSIDKFKKCGVITKDDTEGVKALTVGNPGTSMEVKIELRGIDVRVSEIIPIKQAHQLAL